jgi:hypothetical protein
MVVLISNQTQTSNDFFSSLVPFKVAPAGSRNAFDVEWCVAMEECFDDVVFSIFVLGT